MDSLTTGRSWAGERWLTKMWWYRRHAAWSLQDFIEDVVTIVFVELEVDDPHGRLGVSHQPADVS